ncbi:MAG: class I adenylate-forming enzyme family protein [Bdellovibrionia bacterium]
MSHKLQMTLSQSNPPRFMRFLGKDISFRDAVSFINKYSYFLQNFVEHKKRVGVFMGHSPYIYYSFFGLANTLNQMVPLNPDWSNEELVEACNELGVDVLLIDETLKKRAEEICKSAKKQPKILPVDSRRCGEYDKGYKLPVGMSANDKDVVLWLPSDGTTGKRKWIPYTHTMIEAQALALRFAYKSAPVDSFFTYKLSPLHPFAFIHGGIMPILNGASIFLSDTLVAPDLIPQLMEGKATRLIINPKSLYEFLNALKELNLKWPRLRSITPIKNLVSVSARQLAEELFNESKILQLYGCAESGFTSTMMTMDSKAGDGHTLGAPLPGVTVRILDAHGNEVKAGSGQIGEIVLSGKNVTPGYLKIHNDNDKYAFRGSSFFTGDVGYQTKSGELILVGKKLLAPQHQGQYINPHDAEMKVKMLPGVAEATIVGVENRLGKPTRWLLLQRNNPDLANANDIMKFCAENLPENVRPSNIVMIPEFPYTEWGAIDHHRLARQLPAA